MRKQLALDRVAREHATVLLQQHADGRDRSKCVRALTDA
jgi:hypothetical protein